MLPVGPLPLVAGDLETFVRGQVAACRLSLHLIGKSYGIVPEDSERSIVELQFDAVRGASRIGLTRIVR